jgi:hypothetical protein
MAKIVDGAQKVGQITKMKRTTGHFAQRYGKHVKDGSRKISLKLGVVIPFAFGQNTQRFFSFSQFDLL